MFQYLHINRNGKTSGFNPISQTEEEDRESFSSNEEEKNARFVPQAKGISIAGLSILLVTSITISMLVGIWIGRSMSFEESSRSKHNEKYCKQAP